MGLDLGEMKAQLSAMSFVLDDVDVSEGISYFGQLFAPGRWDDNSHGRVAPGGTYNTQIDADATEIKLKSTANLPAVSNGHIGQETINWSGKTATSLTGVVKGLWPCVNIGLQFGASYNTPPLKGKGYHYHVGTVPFSFLGRKVALYLITWDPVTAAWQPQAEARIIWVGRISDQISQDSNSRRWTLSCESILTELETSILVDQPFDYINGINLRGIKGRTFTITEWDGSTLAAQKVITIPSGVYTHDKLAAVIVKESSPAAGATWTITTSLTIAAVGLTLEANGKYEWRFVAKEGRTITVTAGNINNPCHAIKALGFWLTGDHVITGTPDGSKAAHFIGTTLYDDYHPLHQNCNGAKIRLYRAEKFWDDQGDDIEGTQACVSIKGAIMDPTKSDSSSSDSKGVYLARYNTKSGNDLDLIDDPTLTPYRLDAYVGKKHLEATTTVEVRQVYIPRYQSSNTKTKQGPFELLLWLLLSTGTSTYNHTTYDACPRALSVGIQASLVDIQSFLDADKEVMTSQLAHRELYVIDKATSWLELLQREGKLFSYAVVWRKGKLRLRPVLQTPGTDEWTVTLNEGNRAGVNEFPSSTMSRKTVINQYSCKLDWNPSSAKWGAPYIVNDVDSILGTKITKQVSIEHPGVALYSGKFGNIKAILDLQLVGRPIRNTLSQVGAGLAAVLEDRVFVADVVKFVSTVTTDPKGSGTRSVTSFATVVDVAWNYKTHLGSATLLLHPMDIGYPWAAAAVANTFYNAADQLTLVVRTWSPAAQPHDGAAVSPSNGFKVLIHERAPSDPTNPQSWGPFSCNTYITANAQLQLPSGTALSGWDATKEYVVTFCDYDDATATMINGEHGTWQADVDTEQLGAGDKAHRWG